MRVLQLIGVAAMACSALRAQSAFAVASVKPAGAQSRMGSDFRVLPGGTLRVTNLNLIFLIMQAFDVKHYQVAGAPGWVGSDEFDILAKAEGEPSRAEVMKMLQALLAERFHLKVHRETREGNVYTLVVAKNGFKLQASTGDEQYIREYRNTPDHLPGVSYTLTGKRASLVAIAQNLGNHFGRPVLDRTGIQGEFDFKLDYATDDNPETGPPILISIQEQLGLKLQAAKGPVEMLVIDSIDKLSEN
jgi:uncharacterized protein (TIGR03435 family)